MTYNTLEEIQARKDELKGNIQLQTDEIATRWHGLTAPQESANKGELVAHLVSNSITAIDGFLLVRKLIRTYGSIFKWKKKKKNQ
jgi:hypothetical protein